MTSGNHQIYILEMFVILMVTRKRSATVKKAAAKVKAVAVGTLRVGAKDLCLYRKVSGSAGWKRIVDSGAWLDMSCVLSVAKLFKAARKFKVLVDTKDSRWLKGQLSSSGMAQGARINVLPNGEVLEKAYSLFSPYLRIHDQDSHDHWDVLYQNKGGTWSYVYTLTKRKAHRASKYVKVEKFGSHYSKLLASVKRGLSDSNDSMAVPMFTLLRSKMRIGNLTYFKAHGHRGLTTLMKKNVKVNGSKVAFDFLGKDGVPISLSISFPLAYVTRLKKMLRALKANDYVFAGKTGKPLAEREFKKAFLRYCGEEFYPHIVRSYYATSTVSSFVSGRKKISRDEKEELFLSVAHALGHKKFNKKTQQWQDSYTVTVNNYVRPELVQKVLGMVK